MSDKKMHFGWFSGHGLGPGPNSWNDPRMPESYSYDRPEVYIDMARVMERAGLDFVIFADTLGIPDIYGGSISAYVENAIAMPKLDPAVIAPMIAMHTRTIGVVPTLATTFYPPFMLARLLNSLDHVTRGRIGWNIVTSAVESAAENFGTTLPPHDTRYDIADEYMEVCHKLWRSWDADAVVQDVSTGVFADPAKVRPIDHVGEHFALRGPLNAPQGPQGTPFLVQAGASPRGIRFGGEHADAVIVNKNTVPEMKEYRDRIRARAVECGRDPDDVKVFFIVSPTVAYTLDALAGAGSHVPMERRVEMALAQLAVMTGVDYAKSSLDDLFVPPPGFDGPMGAYDQFGRIDGRIPTVREVGQRMANWSSLPLTGTPEQIADRLEETFDEVGGDGFVIRASWIPDYVNDICTQVIGTLRRRGRLAVPEPGSTLRERLAPARVSG